MKKDNSKLIKSIIAIIAIIGIVASNPIGDAVRDNGNKKLQKNIEVFTYFLFFVLAGCFAEKFYPIPCMGLGYLTLRISMHNLFYNISRTPPLPWLFVGTTATSDDIEMKMSKSWVIFGRVFCLLMAGLFFWLGIK